MNSSLEASYDLVSYPAYSHFHTRLDRLNSIGALFGMTPPPVETCRVLELGCGPGMNLVSLAYRNPGAQFLGIDLSGDQIRQANETAAAIGIQNIEFRHQSIAEIGPESGLFDYILAHGVFSWVPAEVQQMILRICRDHLSPTGIAYISYNTLPGWYQKLWVRDMMKFASDGEDGTKKVAKAQAFLKLIAQSPVLDSNSKTSLQQSLKEMEKRPESYLLHDFLEITNQPMYFQEFMDMASAHGMQYLADAEVNVLIQEEWPPALQYVAPEDSLIRQEQFSDFLRDRTFRKSLLCRAGISLDSASASHRAIDMYAVSFLRRDPAPGPSPVPGATRYSDIGGKGGLFLAPSALNTALLDLETNFPHAVPVRDLLERAKSASFQKDDQRFVKQILDLWKKGYVDLLQSPVQLPKSRGDRPRVSPVARYQALHTSRLTNLDHAQMDIIDAFRNLIPHMDGTRTEAELAQKALDEGIIAPSPQVSPSLQLNHAITQVQRFLDWCLQRGVLLE